MMNLSRPAPPTATCLLAGPWHDSHPWLPAIWPASRRSRAWGLAGNARDMLAWQSEQTLSPTKVAPSIIGGSTGVRSVEHEPHSKANAPSAATNVAPAATLRIFDFRGYIGYPFGTSVPKSRPGKAFYAVKVRSTGVEGI